MSKTLLLADGSVTIQRVIELTFAHEDVRVVSVSDGRRAVQWLDNEQPDVALIDVDLPERDGYEVATHIKKSSRLRNVPVLLLAGAFEPVDQKRARSVGCDGVIVKPFEPQMVVGRVKELLAEAEKVTAAAHREPVKPKPAPTGPADSPALAVLRAAAEASRPAEPEIGRSPKLEPFIPRLGTADPIPTPHVIPTAVAAPAAPPEPLEPPARLVWDDRSPASATTAAAPAPPPPKVSLASAFSALLAAEQSTQPVAPAPPAPRPAVSDASVEEAVRRVLVRMTDDLVRRIVVETAERLIKEEIEKIKGQTE